MMRPGIAALCGTLAGLIALAASAKASWIRAESDRDEIHLGDPVELSITVAHAPGLRVDWPNAPSLGRFELLDHTVAESRQVDQQIHSQAHYTLTAFELGSLELPQIEVTLIDEKGARVLIHETQPRTISVRSVGLDEAREIRDIHGPLTLPPDESGGAWRLLWIVLFAAFTYALIRFVRAGRKRTNTSPLEASLLPHEAAHKALDRLEASNLLARGDVKEYYIAASTILRSCLAAQYPMDALEMTSREILENLGFVGLNGEAGSGFATFFRESDRVKFAKHDPGVEGCRAVVPAVRHLVDETQQDSQPSRAWQKDATNGTET